MRYVLKLMVLAVFAVSASLMVGCGDKAGDTKKTDGEKAKTEKKSSDTSAPSETVSKVDFVVEGMK